MSEIKVLIVDDHALFRRGIADVISKQPGLSVAGEASNGFEAISKAQELLPEVILMDLNMPQCSGLEATQAIHAQFPNIKILVLTVSDAEADLFAAVKFGAVGYLLKKAEPEELVHAVFTILEGGGMISPVMAAKLVSEFNNLAAAEKSKNAETEHKTPDSALSPREEEVLQHVARGAKNKEIAEALFISENTVKSHLQKILDKLHLANRSQAAAYAVKKGILTDGV